MDPFYSIMERISQIIGGIVGENSENVMLLLRPTPSPEHGDLSLPLIRYAKTRRVNLEAVIDDVLGRIHKDDLLNKTVNRIELRNGYLNIRLNEVELSRLYFELLRENGVSMPPTRKPLTIVVEHTSANPVHPLHMGHARNSSLGDTLSRLLRSRGHRVNRRFYIDDVGRQVAVAALGISLLGKDLKDLSRIHGLKPDWMIGYIYSITHLLLDIHSLTQEIESTSNPEDVRELINKRDGLLADLARVLESAPKELGDSLLEGFQRLKESSRDPEEELKRIMRTYEMKTDEKIAHLVRESVEASLEGFRETLGRLGVEFDNWDWESDMVWSGLVREVLEKARRSPFLVNYKDTEALDLSEAASIDEVRQRLQLPKGFDVPPLILVRSDGTTLYTTRDMAYTIYKYRATGADKVINVIGADQKLPQIQIRLALYALGYKKEALETIHYAYEIVRLPGARMSGRKGRLLGLDTVLEETFARALEEVEKRNPGLPKEEMGTIAWRIAVGAVRYSMVSINAMRPIKYSVERATDFEGNSGPYIQYTYARANGILRKHGDILWDRVEYRGAEEPYRRELLLYIVRLPYIAAKAADDLRPELLANYLVELSDKFNSWYQKDSVLQEKNEGIREYKAALTKLTIEMLGLGMDLIGIPRTPRM